MTSGEQGKDSKFQWTEADEQRPERAIVLVPDFSRLQDSNNETRSIESRLEEAIGLAEAINLEIAESGIVHKWARALQTPVANRTKALTTLFPKCVWQETYQRKVLFW